MNILHVNADDRIGGAAIASTRLHKDLRSSGVDSNYLVLNKYNHQSSDIVDFRKIYLENLKLRLGLYFDDRRLRKKQEKFLDGKPDLTDPFSFPETPFDITLHPLYKEADIVHLHWVARFLDYPSFFRKNDKPVVWTVHDRNPFSGGEHCVTKFPYEDYSYLIQQNIKIKKKSVKGKDITVVSPSLEYKGAVESSEILGAFKCHHIPHGIDIDTFKPFNKDFCKAFLGLGLSEKYLLFVASSTDRQLKGMDMLLGALKKNEHINLMVIGNSDSLGQLNNNIIKLGLVSDERILRMAYCAADLFVSPSLEESFGLSIAESLCCGTPVLGLPVGVNPEVIHEELNGKMVENNVDTFSNAIRSILQRNFEQKVVRNSVSEYFESTTNTDKYISLYKQILK